MAPAGLTANDQLPQEERIIKSDGYNEAVNLPVATSDQEYHKKIEKLNNK